MGLDFSLNNNGECVCDENITHNLTTMAEAAGIYKVLWRPEENGYHTARDCIPALTSGLDALIKNPDKFEEYNSPNGWGMYEHFVPFVTRILISCHRYPDATVQADR